MPTSGERSPQLVSELDTQVSPVEPPWAVSSKLAVQRGTQGFAFVSASKAYIVSC